MKACHLVAGYARRQGNALLNTRLIDLVEQFFHSRVAVDAQLGNVRARQAAGHHLQHGGVDNVCSGFVLGQGFLIPDPVSQPRHDGKLGYVQRSARPWAEARAQQPPLGRLKALQRKEGKLQGARRRLRAGRFHTCA